MFSFLSYKIFARSYFNIVVSSLFGTTVKNNILLFKVGNHSHFLLFYEQLPGQDCKMSLLASRSHEIATASSI